MGSVGRLARFVSRSSAHYPETRNIYEVCPKPPIVWVFFPIPFLLLVRHTYVPQPCQTSPTFESNVDLCLPVMRSLSFILLHLSSIHSAMATALPVNSCPRSYPNLLCCQDTIPHETSRVEIQGYMCQSIIPSSRRLARDIYSKLKSDISLFSLQVELPPVQCAALMGMRSGSAVQKGYAAMLPSLPLAL